MGAVKQFKMSTSLRLKVFDLLSRYEPSDIAYTVGGAIYDRMNKLHAAYGQARNREQAKELKKRKDCYFKAAKRYVQAAQSLKLLEIQYL